MRSRIGLPRAKACSVPPTMKVSVAALAPPTPPETGASSVAMPRAAAKRMRLAGAGHIDRRAIDEQRALPRPRHDIVPDRQDVLARRQHGDDDVGVLDGAPGAGDDLDAVSGRGFAQRRYQVEAENVLARLDQVGGHRPAHIAETDEIRLPPCAVLPQVSKFQFKLADGLKVPLDDLRRHRFKLVRTPDRIAVLVDDGRANAFDEIMPGNARQRDTVILLEAFLNALE